MAGDTAGEGELLVQSLQTFQISADVGIYFAVSTLKVRVCNEEVSAVSGSGNQNHVQIVLVDGTVHVCIYEVLSGNCSPVTNDLLLDLVSCKGLSEHRIVQQIQLGCRKIVCRSPICIQIRQILLG